MLRKKSMPSPEKQPRDHPLSLSIDTENAASSTLFATTDPSEPSESQQSEKHGASSSGTNLPLLTAAYMSALTTGATTYAFSFYSSALKMSLHLTQSQLDTLGSATFAAGVFSWIPGMIVDRYGSKLGIVVGGLGNVCVLSLYWFIATGRLWQLNSNDEDETTWLIFVLSILGVLTFMGCALITGSVFKLIVESCGDGSKGKAVGCAKGYVGVGSGVYVCIFRALFGITTSTEGIGPAQTVLMSALPSGMWLASKSLWNADLSSALQSKTTAPDPEVMNTLNFLLMAACLSFFAAVLPAIIFLPNHKDMQSKKPRDVTRSIHFRVVYAGLVLLGMWVVGTSLLELKDDEDKAAHASAKGLPPAVVNKTLRFAANDFDAKTASGGSLEGMMYGQNVIDAIEMDAKIVRDKAISLDTFARESYNRQQFESESLPVRSWNRIRQLSDSAPERHWGTAILLLFMWWGPALSLLCIPPRRSSNSYESLDQEDIADHINIDESRSGGIDETEQDTFLNDALSNRKPMSLTKGEDCVADRNASLGKEFTLAEMLRTSEAWLMTWTFLVLVGGGTLMTCNIGQMTEALGFNSDITPASLALFSAAQGASRVVTGSISESALSWDVPWFCECLGGTRGVARPTFLILASLVSAVAHFSLAVASTQRGFAFGVTLSGWAFGMTWPMMVLITGEVFGTSHVGANYMFYDGFSSAMGTLLLSKFVAQTVYDEHIIKSHGDAMDENFQCYGKGCFQMSHMIVCLLSLTCVVSSFCLLRVTKDVYRR